MGLLGRSNELIYVKDQLRAWPITALHKCLPLMHLLLLSLVLLLLFENHDISSSISTFHLKVQVLNLCYFPGMTYIFFNNWGLKLYPSQTISNLIMKASGIIRL